MSEEVKDAAPKPQDTMPTKQISQTAVLNERLDKLQDIFESGIRIIRTDVQLVTNEVSIIKGTVADVVARVGALETAGSRRSDAVKSLDTRTSANDLAHEAQIAALKVQTDAFEAQVKNLIAIGKRLNEALDVVSKNKLVRAILFALGTVILGLIIAWGASHGIHVEVPK